jgi:hypothetical protein
VHIDQKIANPRFSRFTKEKRSRNRPLINSGPHDFFNLPPPLVRYIKVVLFTYFQPAYYQFGYQVDTLDTGDYHGHMEQQDGNVKRGKYR